MSTFPIDLKKFKKYIIEVVSFIGSLADNVLPRLSLDPSKPKLTDEEKSALQYNIQLLRDAIVLFTATGAAHGVGGHTGESGSLAMLVSDKRLCYLRRCIRYCPRSLHTFGAVPEIGSLLPRCF